MGIVIVRMVSTRGVIQGTWLVVVPFECPPVIDYSSPMVEGILDRVRGRSDFNPESYGKKSMLQVEFLECDADFTEVIA
jgi:hypothetical protein